MKCAIIHPEAQFLVIFLLKSLVDFFYFIGYDIRVVPVLWSNSLGSIYQCYSDIEQWFELLVFSNAFRTFPRILAKRFSSLRQLDMVKIQIPEVEIRDSIALSAVASSASLKFEVHLSPPVGAGTEAIPLYCSSCCRVYRLSNWCISKGQQNLLRYR